MINDPCWLTDAVYFRRRGLGHLTGYPPHHRISSYFWVSGYATSNLWCVHVPFSTVILYALCFFHLTLFAFGEPQTCRLSLPRLKYDHHFNSTSLHHIYFAWPFFSSHCPPRVAPTGVRSSRCALSSCWCCNFYIVRFDLSLPRFRRKALPVRPPRDSWLHAHPLFPLIIYSCSLFVPLLSLLSCSHVTILILYCPFFSFPFFSLSNRALFGLPF